LKSKTCDHLSHRRKDADTGSWDSTVKLRFAATNEEVIAAVQKTVTRSALLANDTTPAAALTFCSTSSKAPHKKQS